MENNLQVANINGVNCYEKDGTAYLDIEAVARGLVLRRRSMVWNMSNGNV